MHAKEGEIRGGLIYQADEICNIKRADYDIKRLVRLIQPYDSSYVLGHSRLITNGLADNQPVVRGDVVVIHNGIIVNDTEVWESLNSKRLLEIDSEVIAALVEEHLNDGNSLETIPNAVLSKCKGTVSTAIILPKMGKAVIFSNNGSLYTGTQDQDFYFSSEEFPLKEIGCIDIRNIRQDGLVLDIRKSREVAVFDKRERKHDLIPKFRSIQSEVDMLQYQKPH